MFRITVGAFGLATLVGTTAGFRCAYLEYRKSVHAEIAEQAFQDIANPNLEVRVVGNTIVLNGWVGDEEEKATMVNIVKAYASASRFFDFGLTPVIMDQLMVKARAPVRTTASAKSCAP